MSDSKATCLSSNWNKKKPGLHHGLKSKFLRLVGKILIGKFPSQIVLRKLGVWVSMLAATIWSWDCFCLFHSGAQSSSGPGETLASVWSLTLQGIRELVEKYTLFTNRTAPKTFPCVLGSDQRVLTSKAQYISFIQANPTELGGIRYPSWQEMSVGSTELSQALLLAQGSRRALLPSVTFSFYNLALLMNSWRHVSMDLHCPN